jgi:maltose/moltooligosaccharide transporter
MQNSSTGRKKPALSFWQIWNMSFGFLGIQFGFALQNANVSRIFETLGAKIEDIPILWVAAPVTGLLIQPIIGFMSDRTWNRLGRRRPYFLAGALLASAALFIMPNSPVLWFAAGMLWMMDASINVAMEPFRAFVGDNLPDEQRTTGFAMQSFFIGAGAVIASLLPYILSNWFDISNEAAAGTIPASVKWSFYIGGSIFLLAVLWTVVKSFEYSPEELAAFTQDQASHQASYEDRSAESIQHLSSRQVNYGLAFLLCGALLTYWFVSQDLKKDLYILAAGLLVAGALFMLAGTLQQKGSSSGLNTMVNDLFSMPATMRQLAVVQFFSWFALFSMWIYTTSAVTKSIYGTDDPTSQLYNEGANWVGVCFAVYSGVAALVAFLLPVLAEKTNRKITHAICLVFGALGLVSIFFISDPLMLLGSMVGVGVAWASIVSMPYAILTGALPSEKMGYYMGVFNFFIVIPQIVAAALLGFFISNFFDNQAVYAMLIGGLSFVAAAVMTLLVEDKK